MSTAAGHSKSSLKLLELRNRVLINFIYFIYLFLKVLIGQLPDDFLRVTNPAPPVEDNLIAAGQNAGMPQTPFQFQALSPAVFNFNSILN
jgi:hypothetical protein